MEEKNLSDTIAKFGLFSVTGTRSGVV